MSLLRNFYKLCSYYCSSFCKLISGQNSGFNNRSFSAGYLSLSLSLSLSLQNKGFKYFKKINHFIEKPPIDNEH